MSAPNVSAREVAFQVVRDVFGPELRSAQGAFDVRARRAELDVRDRAFAAELAYGAIKQRRLLDWYLAPYVGGREKPLPPTIADVLRLGAYQVRSMGGVEAHAAVSETVNLAWRHGHKGTAGLVNAVLRRMVADGPLRPEPADFASHDEYLGTLCSVPTWVVAQFGRAFGDMREAALAGINVAPRHAVTVNALRAAPGDVLLELSGTGNAHPSALVAESIVVASGTVADDPGGRWLVQSESAAMPVDVLAPRPGETVLELCSGRGNKSVQIAARLRGEGSLLSVELDPRKAKVWHASLERAGATNAALVEGDARSAAADVRADAVLLDAPCSGLGLLGRHPEARWRKSPDDGRRLAETQGELLRAAAARTKPGGRLVYAVCSTDPREGPEVVDRFLADDASFARATLPERYAPFVRSGDVVFVPGIEGRDGFYIASLVRTPSAAA
jgi:16S rRNA (cytosine967-C5)-methyltransferase